jgi:membrane protease YdiL (CAAX protease family)
MRTQEDSATEITERLLSGNSIRILLVNLAVMALIPALCEEFLFRGLLITWLKKHISNIHVVVFISACLFSAIHLQFYGFVPRFLLGLYFGYLFIWTGSIWACIIAHFINNAMAVIASYLFNNQFISTEYQHFGNVGNNYLLIALSVLLTSVCIYFLYKSYKLRVTSYE